MGNEHNVGRGGRGRRNDPEGRQGAGIYHRAEARLLTGVGAANSSAGGRDERGRGRGGGLLGLPPAMSGTAGVVGARSAVKSPEGFSDETDDGGSVAGEKDPGFDTGCIFQ